ncbi:NAD(P)-binding protein [Nocardioides agariphilus]|uniref:NAD(P)-binding protein n=1 Tax=Nocardioides agariphilus TaxID=433664 RepID=A0A930VLS4_9ACTN|nr:NAD(P)-binding protein [Nocardioides agariphilus]MBF4767198.1 NAD(P)-binding protein [Nocardioides agariphilus]
MKLPFAVTLGPGSSLADHTGAWRTERAVYVERTAPCGNACPAGEDVRSWLYDAESGGAGYETAWRRIMETNPFPAVCGRVCYHPCETACNRGHLDEAVGINSVERFLGDEALAHGWTIDSAAVPTGRRVLVVGSGPAGLSAAYHLARRGHAVTVRESAPVVGGMMRYGIPRYRLPREVLDAEIKRVLDLGVTVEVDTPVTDLDAVMADEGWDAAFLAVGAQLGHRTYLPAASAARVLDAVSLLHGLEDGERPLLGRRVAVYGGGNTAIDAARTARRLGASDAVVVYRRTRERMPAHADEVADAEEEGVVFHWLSTIERVEHDGLVIEQMELDEDGFPQPTGRTERLSADSVVLALGQDTDLSFLGKASALQVHGGSIDTDPAFATTRPGVFAGGDVVAGERSVTIAIGHGRRAAESIDDWLSGRHPAPAPAVDLAPYEALNTWYFEDADRTHRARLELARRSSTFDEIVHGLDGDTALYEARRCLSCGSCFSCDNCYAMCPDDAVIKLGPPGEYVIDLDYCKGCGLCVQECPAGAITMVPEET